MNNKWRIIFASLAASLMLAACGTSDADDNSSSTDGTNGNAVEEPANTPEVDVEEDLDSDVDENEADGKEQENMSKDAVETKSDAQDYSIMVIPGYTLTSEEPGRDSLFVDEENDTFMRIETTAKGEEAYSFDEWYENLEELLTASGDGAELTELTDKADLPQNEGIKEVKGAEVQSSGGYFKGFVMEREDKLVRVTIYAAEDNEHIEDFVEMASTIK